MGSDEDLEKAWLVLFGYIDDQLHAHQDAPILKMRRETILNLLDRLGLLHQPREVHVGRAAETCQVSGHAGRHGAGSLHSAC